MNADETSGQARDRYIQTFGDVAARDYLPTIAGRIAALLYVSNGPVSFGALERELGVSRGSISTNTRLLEELGTIERVEVEGARGHYFRAAPNAGARTAEYHLQRTETALDMIRAASAEMRTEGQDLSPEILGKMQAIEIFYEKWVKHLRAFRDEMAAGDPITPPSAGAGTRRS
ncbi:GbsR/MarR family transcriptional regulator [Sphingobium phenoxybenzoativorans]|uniref:GbsR/MarR family transcriptional regulator n=1 Tax=Sphingobium phenoxybenzoativorans TaxID=1592790 RepID=UPI000872C80C|nr:MarR family transcriptional regulator [Sphingobium phenoxybenzoativorans]